MKIDHYQLVTAHSPEDLSKAVQKEIGHGWQPWEAPSLMVSGVVRYFAQAMVKFEKPKKDAFQA